MKNTLLGRFVPALFGAAVSLVSFVTPSAFATPYFVDSTAAAGGTGSFSSPWNSFTQVNAVTFTGGDVIAFKRGDTWANQAAKGLILHGSGDATNGVIRLTAYDSAGIIGGGGSGNRPILQAPTTHDAGGIDFTLSLVNVEYWTVDNLDVRGGQRACIGIQCKGFTSAKILHNITIQDSICQLSDYDMSYATPWLGRGIYFYNQGLEKNKFDGLLIQNVTIQDVFSQGIYEESDIPKAQYSDPAYYSTNVRITACHISYTLLDGITLFGSKDFQVDHNTLTLIGKYWGAGAPPANISDPTFNGIFWVSCYGGTLENNTISYVQLGRVGPVSKTDPSLFLTDSMAIDLDKNNSGTFYVQYNVSHDNYDGFMEALSGSLADTLNPNPGVVNKCVVWYNISYNDDLHATTTVGTDDGENYAMLIAPDAEHLQFYHNTFYCGTGPCIVNERWPAPTPTNQAVFIDNLFYCPNGFYSSKSGGANSTNLVSYDHNGFSLSPGTIPSLTNPIVGDPLFRNASSPSPTTNLQLLSATPDWNAGVSTAATNPTPPIDAFEYTYDQGLTVGADVFEDEIRLPLDSNLTDTSGHGNSGTFTGGTVSYLTSGQHSGSACLSLTGAGYVSTPHVSFTSEIGLDLWVYPTTTTGYRRLVDQIAVGGHDGYNLDLTPGNDVRFNVGYTVIVTSTALTSSTWSHVEATYTQNGAITIYINGVQAATTTVGNTAIPSNAYSIFIGADRSGLEQFQGRLDDVKIRFDGIVR